MPEASVHARRLRGGWLRHAGRLALKELREILRDRRTIVTLVLMPILVYPLIGVTFQKFLATQLTNQPKLEYRLGFRTVQDALSFQQILLRAQALAAELAGKPYNPRRVPDGTEDDPIIQMLPNDPAVTLDVESLVSEREVEVGIFLKPDHGTVTNIELLTEDSSIIGRSARRYLEDRLLLVNQEFFVDALRRLDPKARPPFALSKRTLKSTDPSTGFSLSTLVPLILILMTVTGAVYPAIDLTAGERERGTLEALISAPVRREELLLAKYVAVLSVALLTAIANLTAMTATAYATGLESLLFGRGGLSPLLILKVFGVLAVFAGFFSSVLLAVTSFARSFKEAQAYLIPVMIVSIAPGMLALMPGLKMSFGLALAPLANMVLLTRDLFDGQLEALPATTALISTLIYTVIGLVFAAKIFGTDAVLYGSSGSWTDLWQRPAAQPARPEITQVLGCLAVVLAAYLILGGLMSRWVESSLNTWLVGQAGLTILLFIGLPALFSTWQRIPLPDAFELRAASPLVFLAAVIAGLSLWPFAYEAEVFTLPVDSLREMIAKSADLMARLKSIPFPVRLIVFALLPAVTEELFFRGYLMKGLERGWGAWPAILISGAIFGAFHIFTRDFLSLERFLPTAILGWCLGWVCLRSGSVLPGMLLHMLHNGFLLTVSEYAESLQSAGIGTEEQRHLPAAWLITAGALVLTAWFTLMWTRKSKLSAAEAAG